MVKKDTSCCCYVEFTVIVVKICIFIPSLCLIHHGDSPISILFTTPWSWQKQFWFQHHSHYVLIATKITITFVSALRSLNCSISKKKEKKKKKTSEELSIRYLRNWGTGGSSNMRTAENISFHVFRCMFFLWCLSLFVET